MARSTRAPKKAAPIETRDERRTARVRLLDDAVVNHADRLARLDQEIEKLEAEKKAAADHYKDEIQSRQREARELAAELRQRWGWRQVDCQIIPDYGSLQIIVKRQDPERFWHEDDDGGIVEQRPMTEVERQRVMEFEGGK